jgi:hypothetical protein
MTPGTVVGPAGSAAEEEPDIIASHANEYVNQRGDSVVAGTISWDGCGTC